VDPSQALYKGLFEAAIGISRSHFVHDDSGRLQDDQAAVEVVSKWLLLPWTDGDDDEDEDGDGDESSEESEEEEEEDDDDDEGDQFSEEDEDEYDDAPYFSSEAKKRNWLQEAWDVWRRKGYRPDLYEYAEFPIVSIRDTGGA
jgi:hypothetical protein